MKKTKRVQLKNGFYRFYVHEIFNDKIRKPSLNNRTPELSEAIFPVVIDQLISEEIAANADDITEVGIGAYNSGYCIFGFHNSNNFHPGFRFTSVDINQGVTINSGSLVLNVTSVQNGGGSGYLYGYDTDDAISWSASTLPTNMTKTSNRVDVGPYGSTGIIRIDVKDIIQEIINRPGWVSGNDLSLGMVSNNSPPGPPPAYYESYFEDYSAASSNPPLLEIDFSGVPVSEVVTGVTKRRRNPNRRI